MLKFKLVVILLLFSFALLKAGNEDSLLVIWKNASKHDTLRAYALHSYSRKLVFNNPDTSLILSRQLLKFAREKKLIRYEIGALNNIAISYYAKGDYEKAIDHYSKSTTMLRELISSDNSGLKNFAKTQLGKTYNNIGNVYLDKGDYPLALDFYFQSLKMVEEMGDKRAQSNSLGNIGIIYGIQKNYEFSINYFRRSLEMDSLVGDELNVANNYSNISNLYQESGDLQRSLDYQMKSLALREKLKDKGGVILSMVSLGSLNTAFGDIESQKNNKRAASDYYEKAKDYYEKALLMSKELNELRNEAIALMGLGNAKIKLGEVEGGISDCGKSLDISENIESDVEIKDACHCLYEGYNLKKNSDKALLYFRRYISLRDTLNSAERIREIAQKQFEFDYNKKAVADSLKTMEQRVSIQAELKHEQTRRYYLYGGLALVIIFAGFMFNRYKISQQQKKIIEKQKEVVEEKQKEILDSIQYAKKIQNTLLAHDSLLKENLGNYFILYKPKDIVSGDFYWATRKDHKFYFAVCDSTGHGVPGAFMSLLNASLLNEAIVEKNIEAPGEVFNYVREKLIGNLSAEAQKDGMDGVLLCFDKPSGALTYAAANNKPVLISNHKLIELPNDKMPVGTGERKQSFSTYPINFKAGDHLYLFTDGYADQFGGDKGKKFKHKQLQFKFQEIDPLPVSHKKAILETAFQEWKGGLEQVDDVTVVGIRL